MPPLQCESMNITSEETCIDYYKDDLFFDSFVIKYQNIGGTMTCSKKNRLRSFSVVCGDACAWTEGEFFDSGTWLAPGLAVILPVALAALAAAVM